MPRVPDKYTLLNRHGTEVKFEVALPYVLFDVGWSTAGRRLAIESVPRWVPCGSASPSPSRILQEYLSDFHTPDARSSSLACPIRVICPGLIDGGAEPVERSPSPPNGG
jgi:hypothetical protein